MPLVSPTELADRLGDRDLRIADVRWRLGDPDYGPSAFQDGHVPGAVRVDLDTDLSAPEGPGRHPLPSPRTFAQRLGELGFGTEHHVVAVDDAAGAIASRLWWMLDDLGHPRVSVLDGGLVAWRRLGLPWTAESRPLPAARMALRAHWSRTIERAAIKKRRSELRLLDARAAERFRGDEEPIDAAAGHIPGAENLPFTEQLGDGGTFRAPASLRALHGEESGGAAETVVYCGSGVTACHLALGRRVAGLRSPLLYPGSWSDWAAAGEDVETGPP